MALETVTHIADLNAAYPDGSEPKNQGDDHIRNTKKAVKNALAGFAGTVFVTGADGGVVNAYTLTPSHAIPAYSPRMLAVFSPTFTNTGAATLNVSGLGTKAIKQSDGTDVTAGDLMAGRIYGAFYNGTAFQLNAVTQNYIDQISIAGTVPGVANPANTDKFFTTNGTNGLWASVDLRGAPVEDKGSSGTTAQVLNYADGEGQTITATGSHSLTVTGLLPGRLSGILAKMVNYGAYSLTTTGIAWIKLDGTTTTNFATAGITLSTTGISLVLFFSFGDGIVYAKAA